MLFLPSITYLVLSSGSKMDLGSDILLPQVAVPSCHTPHFTEIEVEVVIQITQAAERTNGTWHWALKGSKRAFLTSMT